MAKLVNFQDLLVWQKAHQLTLDIYKVSNKFPRSEEFGLSSQMRRSSSSSPTNIAEGFKRKSNKDSIHFYNMAECSLEELKYQLILVRDLKYISMEEFNNLYEKAEEVSRLLYGWIKSQK